MLNDRVIFLKGAISIALIAETKVVQVLPGCLNDLEKHYDLL